MRTREQQDKYNENRRIKYAQEPEARRSQAISWNRKNPGKRCATEMRRRARMMDQCPPDSDKELIDKIYENRPEGHHVDHIVALANGGPHHQDNLQYLTASDNCSKGAR